MSRAISKLDALMTMADAIRGNGLEERPEVRRALHRVDGWIHELLEQRKRDARNALRVWTCVRCSRPADGLTCKGCRGFLPWELRVQFRQADDAFAREELRDEAMAWLGEHAPVVITWPRFAVNPKKRRKAA